MKCATAAEAAGSTITLNGYNHPFGQFDPFCYNRLVSSSNPPLRRDAVRNRQKILDAARAAIAENRPLALNELAREAEVGVGTAYRHFATTDVLRVALIREALSELLVSARLAEIKSATDPAAAFSDFLNAALIAQLRDDALSRVVDGDLESDLITQALIVELTSVFSIILAAVRSRGVIRADLTQSELVGMLCGISHTARRHPPAEANAVASKFLAVTIAGLRAKSTDAGSPGATHTVPSDV